MRSCGDCQLCCKLLPVRELGKGAATRCKFQKAGTGCTIYKDPTRPPSCRTWSCMWLHDETLAGRPDHTHVVVDPTPDLVVMGDDAATGVVISAIQIWVDPHHKDAHRNQQLRDWLAKVIGDRTMVIVVRYNSHDGTTLIPPQCSETGRWEEMNGGRAVMDAPTALQVRARATAATMEEARQRLEEAKP